MTDLECMVQKEIERVRHQCAEAARQAVSDWLNNVLSGLLAEKWAKSLASNAANVAHHACMSVKL